jgi:hypothetical protein
MTKSQRLCNGKVGAYAGKCDKVEKLVQACNNVDSSSRLMRLYRNIRKGRGP